MIGDGDQPESGSGVGGVDRPDGLVHCYAGLGPLSVPVGPRSGRARPRGIRLCIPGLDPLRIVKETGDAFEPVMVDCDEDCGNGHGFYCALLLIPTLPELIGSTLRTHDGRSVLPTGHHLQSVRPCSMP